MVLKDNPDGTLTIIPSEDERKVLDWFAANNRTAKFRLFMETYLQQRLRAISRQRGDMIAKDIADLPPEKIEAVLECIRSVKSGPYPSSNKRP